MLDAIVEYARCNLILYEDTAYLQQPSCRIIKSLGCVDSSRSWFPFYSLHVAARLPDVEFV